MKPNVGGIDKTIRIIAIGAYLQSWWGAVGIIPLITALINWCPAYLPFGWSTCKAKEAE